MQYTASVGLHKTEIDKKVVANATLTFDTFPSPITFDDIKKYAPIKTVANPDEIAISYIAALEMQNQIPDEICKKIKPIITKLIRNL